MTLRYINFSLVARRIAIEVNNFKNLEGISYIRLSARLSHYSRALITVNKFHPITT